MREGRCQRSTQVIPYRQNTYAHQWGYTPSRPPPRVTQCQDRFGSGTGQNRPKIPDLLTYRAKPHTFFFDLSGEPKIDGPQERIVWPGIKKCVQKQETENLRPLADLFPLKPDVSHGIKKCVPDSSASIPPTPPTPPNTSSASADPDLNRGGGGGGGWRTVQPL